VRLNEIFLQEDPPSPHQLHLMHEFIQEKLASVVRRLGNLPWERTIATSATASAVASAVARVPRSQRDDIDRLRVPTAQVRKLYARLSGLGLAGRRKTTGIGPRRAEIIVPGLAVLLDFLKALRQPAMYYSRAGVREGIIADLAARNVGAELSHLTRDQRREVEDMCRRFGVSLEHARKVAHISGLLFTALSPLHQLPPAAGKLLEAASYLLDAGHYISGVSHHKHSYYVVVNSDMPGFTDRERLLIASLCRYHRKAMPSPVHGSYQALSPDEKKTLMLLIPILRLADNLDRSHEQSIDGVECRLQDGEIGLQVRSRGAIDLVEWGAQRAGEAFQQVYNRRVVLTKAED
jgi:exopolyphosphatase/guanosine-5'-triphosphate,3'-diphosphate pyrophosphatase